MLEFQGATRNLKRPRHRMASVSKQTDMMIIITTNTIHMQIMGSISVITDMGGTGLSLTLILITVIIIFIVRGGMIHGIIITERAIRREDIINR